MGVKIEAAPRLICSFRLVWAVVAFFGYCIMYMQKVNMGIAIVAMTNHTALEESKLAKNPPVANMLAVRNSALNSFENYRLMKRSETLHGHFESFHLEANLSAMNDGEHCRFTLSHGHGVFRQFKDGPFVWDKQIQGLILSSFFYGYIITRKQIPGGYISTRFGGKYVFGFSVLFGSVFTILAPMAAKWDYKALIVCRFLTGLSQGAAYPSMSSVWASWAPESEKSRLIGFANSGGIIGSIIGLPLGGFLATLTNVAGGWPLIFYSFGGVGIIWFAIMFFITSNTPADHKMISTREKEYIMQTAKKSKQRPRTPWIKILTSKVCISIMITKFCFNWGNYLFLTQLPSFLKDVLKFDIKSNGLTSALPYVGSWIILMLSSLIADYLITTNKLSRTSVRKLFNGIGFLIPMLALLGLSFAKCSTPYTGVALLVVGVAFTGCSWGAGFFVNINEVCGEFSGIFYGITNTFGTMPGLFGPYLVGVLTANQKQEEWRIVFWITSVVYLVSFIVYTIFSRAELQDWAVTDLRSSEDSKDADSVSKELV